MLAMRQQISTAALWRSLRRVLAMVLLLALIGLATGVAIVVQAGRSDLAPAEAAIVMLGGSGSEARLDRARQWYVEGRVARILLAGSDTAAGRAALLARNVKDEIISELPGSDPRAQLAAASELLAAEQLHSVVLIAEPVETLRWLKIARDHGLTLHSLPTTAQPDLRLEAVGLEIGRYLRYIVLDR